jgi:hypothetical protein
MDGRREGRKEGRKEDTESNRSLSRRKRLKITIQGIETGKQKKTVSDW